MLLNRLEFALMNNPLRAAVQRKFEAPRLLRMGGTPPAGRLLEVGCGRGVGIEVLLESLPGRELDAFDLDPRMVRLARQRVRREAAAARPGHVRLWVGDATAIPARSATYGAVFDFGIVHHVPDWRAALREVARVLMPGGRLYAEEMLAGFIDHPVARALLKHPRQDRFDAPAFLAAIEQAGLRVDSARRWSDSVLWAVATKR